MCSIIYRILTLLFSCMVLSENLSFSNSSKNIYMMSFFTIQSTLFCMIVTVLLIKNDLQSKEYSDTLYLAKGMSTISILITLLSYHFVLKNANFSMTYARAVSFTTNDLFIHYVIPIIYIVDWAVFQEKGHYRNIDAIKFLIAPAVYFSGIMIRCHRTKEYPYFFLNLDSFGITRVFINVIIFSIIYLLIGYIFVTIDRYLSRRHHKNHSHIL